MKIIYTSWGLANRFPTHIELNENLKKYPKLQREILRHERRHTDKMFSLEDLKMDLSSSNIKTSSIILFMLRHPKSLTQILPFYWTYKKGFVYDLSLILAYIVLMGILFGTVFLGSLFL